MLLVAHDDLRDRDATRLLEGFEQEAVGLLRAALGQQVVALAEEQRVDLVDRDELADVDRVRQLDIEPVDVFITDLDKAALLELEAANDLVGIDVFPVVLLILS